MDLKFSWSFGANSLKDCYYLQIWAPGTVDSVLSRTSLVDFRSVTATKLDNASNIIHLSEIAKVAVFDLNIIMKARDSDLMQIRSHSRELLSVQVMFLLLSNDHSPLKSYLDVHELSQFAQPISISFDLGEDFEVVSRGFSHLREDYSSGRYVTSTPETSGFLLLNNLPKTRNRDVQLLYSGALFATSIAVFIDFFLALSRLLLQIPKDQPLAPNSRRANERMTG
jgi:hypothetical protein